MLAQMHECDVMSEGELRALAAGPSAEDALDDPDVVAELTRAPSQPEDPDPWDEALMRLVGPHAAGSGAAPPDGDVPAISAGVVAELAPDASLGSLLEQLSVVDADEALLVEIVAAYKRLEAWSAAGAAHAAAELARRPRMRASVRTSAGERLLNVAAEELAMRLGVTRNEGQVLVDVGRAVTGAGSLRPLGEALRSGEVSWQKTTTIARTLIPQPDPVAFLALEEVLPEAPTQTVHQISRALTKALVAVDREEADQRHQRARRLRSVSHPSPAPDGMADVRSHLPAEGAVVLDLVLDAAARAAKQAGDGRNVDQLRADALVVMAQSALDAGCIGAVPCTCTCTCTCAGAAHGSSPGPDGVPTRPGSDAGTGSSPGRRRPPMPLTGVRSRHTDVRITVPIGMVLAVGGRTTPASGPDPGVPPGATGSSGSCVPPDGSAPRDPTDRPGPEEILRGGTAGRSTDLRWATSEVAWLDGYGPLNDEQALSLAAHGLFRRLLTDPVTGAVLDVGRSRYRPPAELARLVRARDVTCTRPGCTVPADRCQLDHLRPWTLGGRTSAENLAAECERDHALKTSGAFQVRQEAPGVYVWRTAAGLVYRRRADGTVRRLPVGTVFRPAPEVLPEATSPPPF